MRLKLIVLPLLCYLCGCLAVQGQTIRKRKIKKLFKHSLIMNSHFTGFALYDIDKQQTIYELNADKYFTPASNTKLLTFYTCLKMLGDSVPALQYVTRGDSLVFWGTADPSFLHSQLKGTNGAAFLIKSNKSLYWSSGRYPGNIYGPGWAWDDYNEYYQAEISELPLEDNLAHIYAGTNGRLNISPAYLNAGLKCDSNYHPAAFMVKRGWNDNSFIYPAMPVPRGFKQNVPLKTSPALTLALLQDTLKKQVGEVHLPLPPDAKIIYSSRADSVYRLMLQTSDNFIAEQLLLACAVTHWETLNQDSVISYALRNYLAALPDKPRWVDGSGLSRYNLITPRDIIVLLHQIYEQLPDKQLLHSLLPAGGLSGTLQNVYPTNGGVPFVWAKTGSVSNNYNQSGYLVTRKGKRLAFSFMNNNFMQPGAAVKGELARIITCIHQNF